MIILILGETTYTGRGNHSGTEVTAEKKETVLSQINNALVPRRQGSIASKQMTHRTAKAEKTKLSNLQHDRSGQTDVSYGITDSLQHPIMLRTEK